MDPTHWAAHSMAAALHDVPTQSKLHQPTRALRMPAGVQNSIGVPGLGQAP